ncbi:LysM peptidoglycan-binding domain-containing protein [Fluviicola sp.]|uniref:CIS tube protein n=1 Tax=Fluviicola sp. TaxID=1917219 RepID=UPI00262F6DD8|nr:LysM peptidoglycan-binding domain-containing protein [Fluviicola sp.]
MGPTINMKGGVTGELKKLTIQAYSDPEFKKKVVDGLFTTLINPEKFVLNHKVEYIVPDSTKDKTPPYYQNTPPSDIELEFLFDDTGVFDENSNFSILKNRESKGVEADIEKFMKIAYDINSEIHRPNYLEISWGALLFQGVLAEVSIEYKLFAPNAKPIRAIAKTKFKKFIEPKKATADSNPNSPDLTHVRVAEEGDTLPLMTQRIYGDSKYYLEVARVNKLTAFRKLKAGQRLFFPPIQKPD